MYRNILLTLLFVFSIFVYGNAPKKIGQINNFKIDSDAIVISNGNILINAHYDGINNGFDDYKLSGVNIYDIKDINHLNVLYTIPLNDYPMNMDISRDKKYLFILQANLKIYNIESIKSPKLVASYYIDNDGRVSFSVSKNRDYLYITKPLSKTKIQSRDNNFAFYIYDIKDLNHIRLVSKKVLMVFLRYGYHPMKKDFFIHLIVLIAR